MIKKLVLGLFVICCVKNTWAGMPDNYRIFIVNDLPVLVDASGAVSNVLPEFGITVDRKTGKRIDNVADAEELPTYTYIEAKDLYESGDSPCYEASKQGEDGLTDINRLITSLCKQQFATISNESKRYIQKLSAARPGDRSKDAQLANSFQKISQVADNALSTINHPVLAKLPFLAGDVTADNCILSLETLQAAFEARVAEAGTQVHEVRKLAPGVSLDACILLLDIYDDMERFAVYDENVCPERAIVSSEDILGMEYLDEKFLNKDYHFNISYLARLTEASKAKFRNIDNSSAVLSSMQMARAYENADESRRQLALGNALIFNGRALVVCENNQPVMVIKPSFSGYVGCQEAKYQNLPGVGGVPNGVYVMYHDMLESFEKAKDKESWGDYRIPLIPAQETNTYGRTSMYLHGTSKAEKKRSGGCISLGLSIDEFVNTPYFRNHSESLVFVVTE